jgi:mono/diheme cytochrome c family protein
VAALFVHLGGIPRYATRKIDLQVEVTPARVERGRRTVLMLCQGCHLDPTTRALTGKRMVDVPAEFGVIYSKNITQHRTKGIGAWTDGEIAFLLRTGIARDGRYNPPYMAKLAKMADEDLKDLIAFLRSDDPMVRAADVDDRECEPSFLTKLLCRVAFKPFPYPEREIKAPDPADEVGLGRYLVTGKLDCYPCHSADFKTVDYFEPEKSPGYMGGGIAMPDLDGRIVYVANITPDAETGIGGWTKEQFRRTLKGGLRPDHRPLRYPMLPFPELSDAEADAIFAYLRTVPALRKARPASTFAALAASEPLGKQIYHKYGCDSCHGARGLGLYDLRQGPRHYPTREQLMAYIRNPERYVPGIKMPTWEGVIEESEYEPLAEYVTTLAGGAPEASPSGH